MENEKSKKLITCFERVIKMVEYFEKRGLTLNTYYTTSDALLFVFDSTDGDYEYTVKVYLHGYFAEDTDEGFDQWLKKLYIWV